MGDDEDGGNMKSFGLDDEHTVVGSASGSRFSTKTGRLRSRTAKMRDVEDQPPPQETRFANLDRTVRIL